jgi:MoaA/NifB/PqqE/SkfB family radical SAM enzyme
MAGLAAAFLHERALRAAQPVSALLELTYACNWRCVFCYNPRHHDERPLGLAEWREVLDDLRALGSLNLTFTGGEPLAHPEALDIMAAARERAMTVRLFTNGGLVTEAIARRLGSLHPVGVELSLHGATAATHDRATAKPGSFDALWRGLALLRAAGLPVVIKTPLTCLNEHELEDMIALAEREGLSYTVDPTITHKDDGDPSPLRYGVSPAGLARLYEVLGRLGRLPASSRVEGGVNCGLGRTTLAVDPEGNVYPCPQWRRTSLGNVRKTRLLELWASSPVRVEAAAVAREANDALVRAGGPMARFPFCPALALERTGDALHADPLHLAQAEAAEKARHAAR